MYKGAGNNGMTLVPNKPNKEQMIETMTTKEGKSFCLTAQYDAARPNRSRDRKEKTMIPVDDMNNLPEGTRYVYDENDKSHKIETKKEYISKQSVEKYVEDVNAEFNDPYNKKTVKGDKSTTLRTNSSNGNMWVNDKAIKETKPKKAYDIPREILKDNERQRRVYDPSGKSPTILGRSDSPKITTPKQVGIATDINGHDILKRVYSPDGKSPTVNTCQGGNREPKVVKGGAFRARSVDKDGNRVDWKDTKPQQMLELRKDQKSNTVSSVAKDSVVVDQELTWRKLTPLECERLQTVPDNYTDHVSNTQRYKMLGNGWTVEVIKHIFQNMEIE